MQVLVYSKSDCSYCTKLKQLLYMLKIDYKEKVLDTDFTNDWYKANIKSSYPAIYVDGELIGGYQEFANWALDQNKFG